MLFCYFVCCFVLVYSCVFCFFPVFFCEFECVYGFLCFLFLSACDLRTVLCLVSPLPHRELLCLGSLLCRGGVTMDLSCLSPVCYVLLTTAVLSLVASSGLNFNTSWTPSSLVPGPFPYPALPRSCSAAVSGVLPGRIRLGPWSPLSLW